MKEHTTTRQQNRFRRLLLFALFVFVGILLWAGVSFVSAGVQWDWCWTTTHGGFCSYHYPKNPHWQFGIQGQYSYSP